MTYIETTEKSGYDNLHRSLWVPVARNAPDLYIALKALYDAHSHSDLSDLELQEEAAAGNAGAGACLKARRVLSKVPS